MRRVPFAWGVIILGLPGLGRGYTLRAKGGECDVTGVNKREHSTPTTPKHQQNVCSCKAATYVIAAPDCIRSAGSTGEFASAGFSRTLEGESTATNWGAYQRTISKTGNAPWSLLCQAPRRQYHYRNRGSAVLHALSFEEPGTIYKRPFYACMSGAKDPHAASLDTKLPPTVLLVGPSADQSMTLTPLHRIGNRGKCHWLENR